MTSVAAPRTAAADGRSPRGQDTTVRSARRRPARPGQRRPKHRVAACQRHPAPLPRSQARPPCVRAASRRAQEPSGQESRSRVRRVTAPDQAAAQGPGPDRGRATTRSAPRRPEWVRQGRHRRRVRPRTARQRGQAGAPDPVSRVVAVARPAAARRLAESLAPPRAVPAVRLRRARAALAVRGRAR